MRWKSVAKDGADLPPNQSTTKSAVLTISVGETYDFEYEPSAPGELRLEVLRAGVATTQAIRVVR